MRKLRSDKEAKKKQKEELLNEESNKEIDYSNELPFTKFDYIIYALFFVVTLFNNNVLGVVIVLSVILIGSFIYKQFSKNLSNNFMYRLFVFLLLSIIALPVRMLILKFM